VDPILVLASGSERRQQILRALGIPFRVVVSSVDEAPLPGEGAEDLVARLARAKASRVAEAEPGPVLGADTEVVLGGAVLGKPSSPEDARRMLGLLSGRTHTVLTGVCLLSAGKAYEALGRTAVQMIPLEDAEIARYVGSGEPMGKAGGYHIEGRGAGLVESVTGSPSNVAGLPAHLVLALARKAGLSLGRDG
jgi:septum formation protein